MFGKIGFPFIWMPTDCKQEQYYKKIAVWEAINLYCLIKLFF